MMLSEPNKWKVKKYCTTTEEKRKKNSIGTQFIENYAKNGNESEENIKTETNADENK